MKKGTRFVSVLEQIIVSSPLYTRLLRLAIFCGYLPFR